MEMSEWKDPKVIKITNEVTEPWIPVLETFSAATHLQIKVEGSWTPMAHVEECGPNGLLGLPIQPERLVLPECAFGALLGKIGGSSATHVAGAAGGNADATITAGKPFAVGSYCVVKIPDKAVGPLFVGFNGLMRPVLVKNLTITIQTATIAE